MEKKKQIKQENIPSIDKTQTNQKKVRKGTWIWVEENNQMFPFPMTMEQHDNYRKSLKEKQQSKKMKK